MLNKTCFASAFRNSPVCLELKMKTIQFSARKDLILDAVFHSLEENGIDGLKREVVVLLPPVSSQPLPETALCSGCPPHTWLSGLSLSCVLELLCSPH